MSLRNSRTGSYPGNRYKSICDSGPHVRECALLLREIPLLCGRKCGGGGGGGVGGDHLAVKL